VVRTPVDRDAGDFVPFPEEAVRRGVTSLGGCLLRLVIIAVILFLLVMGGGFLWVIRG
jgi:hypothetical protein